MSENTELTPESASLPEITNLPNTTIADSIASEELGGIDTLSPLPIEELLPEEEGLPEEKELTDEEKRELKIQALKDSHIKFHPIKNGTKTLIISREKTPLGREKIVKSRITLSNVTVNQFGADYHKKRQRKNKMAKASRKANRT